MKKKTVKISVRYVVECFVPKAPNVMNDRDHWVVCHRFAGFNNAVAKYNERRETETVTRSGVLLLAKKTEK